MAAPQTSALDPFRLQLLRQLQAVLSQITVESIQEQGENYDRQKRNDKFYNTVKLFADHVVELKEKQEALRSSSAALQATPLGNNMGLQPFNPSSSASLQNGMASLNPSGLSGASVPKQWGLADLQSRQGSAHVGGSASITRPSVSPKVAKDVSFSSAPSLHPSRGQSSESVPTVAASSASLSPAMGTVTQNGNSIPSSASVSPNLQKKPSTTFGFPPPQRKEPTSLTSLEKFAISTTTEIEASLALFGNMNPGQKAPVQGTQLGSRIEQSNNSDDNMEPASGSRKRKRQKKQWCTMCDDHKEGFRGPHELQRHINIQHQTKKTVFIVYDDSPEGKMFKDCKHCSRRKIYGQDYNAACHLRRAHFNKRLKTDTAEQKEFKQLHPDFPPMEELRPWLRKCLVDVSLLKDPKYIDNQDDALLKVEPAVRHEENSSSDQDASDDELPQPEAPVTPPAEPQTDVEAEAQPQQTFGDATMEDMSANLGDLEFPLDFDELDPNGYPTQSLDFPFGDAPTQAMVPLSQTSATPRNVNYHLQALGIQPDQIDSGILNYVESNVFNFPGFEAPPPFGANMNVDPKALAANSAFMSFDDFDPDQFLNGNGL